MPKYELSEPFFFRETGTKHEAGETVELTEEQAAERNAAHPGLLKLARMTTQGAPTKVVRSNKPASSTRKKKK